MPTPSQNFNTSQELLNYINTYILPNGVEAITGELHNNVENGLLQLTLRSILNYQGQKIYSGGGNIVISKAFNLITGSTPSTLSWQDGFFLKEFYVMNTNGTDIPLADGFVYYDAYGAEKNSIPANSTIHIARAENGTWTNYYPPSGDIVISNPLVITSHPTSRTITEGNDTTFTVVASGGITPYSYQWYFEDEGQPILGATSASFTLEDSVLADSGDYFVIVTDALGHFIQSNSALLTVNVSTMVVTLQPVSQNIATGSNVTFTVAFGGGTPPYTQKWQKDGVDIPGATGLSFTIINAQPSDNANYRAVGFDSGTQTVTSNPATLIVASGIFVTYGYSNTNDYVNDSTPITISNAQTQTITHNQDISLNYPQIAQDTYIQVKIPDTESIKNAFNNGTNPFVGNIIPEYEFMRFVTGGFQWIIARNPTSFDYTQPLNFVDAS